MQPKWRFVLALASGLAATACEAQADEPASKLVAWYDALGTPRASETFGRFLARAARIQHGVKYAENSQRPGVESLEVDLDAFECVSYIESALAVARCGWRSEPTEACFVGELEASRYRSGRMGDYASRLHYFIDWIGDNEARGRVANMTASLGGEPVHKDFFYISERVLKPSSADEALTREVESTEARLSATSHAVLTRETAPPVLAELEDGDLVAFVRERPGLLVHHAGFVYWANGTPRLLHASSYHGRVVITVRDVTNYLLRRPERRGIIVARPLAPPKQ